MWIQNDCRNKVCVWNKSFYFNFSAGFKFYESSNDVILCPGNEDGFLPTQFFKRVVDRKTGKFEFIAKQLLCRQKKRKLDLLQLIFCINNNPIKCNPVYFDAIESWWFGSCWIWIDFSFSIDFLDLLWQTNRV